MTDVQTTEFMEWLPRTLAIRYFLNRSEEIEFYRVDLLYVSGPRPKYPERPCVVYFRMIGFGYSNLVSEAPKLDFLFTEHDAERDLAVTRALHEWQKMAQKLSFIPWTEPAPFAGIFRGVNENYMELGAHHPVFFYITSHVNQQLNQLAEKLETIKTLTPEITSQAATIKSMGARFNAFARSSFDQYLRCAF